MSPSRGSPNRPAHRANRSNARRTNPAASPDEGARASGTFRQTKRERLRPEPACQGRNGRPQRVAPSPTDSRPPLHAGNNGCTYTPYQRRKRWQPAEHGGLTKQHGPASARQARTRSMPTKAIPHARASLARTSSGVGNAILRQPPQGPHANQTSDWSNKATLQYRCSTPI